MVSFAREAGDAILNPDYVTYVKSTTGAPLVLPCINDTSEDAVAIGENAQGTVDTVQYPGNVKLGAISYRQTFISSV